MVEIEHLTKTHENGLKALDDLTLSFPPGVHGLLGPNGAGKTTLMRILSTLLMPTAGRLRVMGYELPKQHQEVRRLLGYLPQAFGLYPDLGVGETMDYFALMRGVRSRDERYRLAEKLLTSVRLWDQRDRRVGGLSGGMKRRLGIALTLIGTPRLVIVDEPTAGLDPEERIAFRNLLSELFSEDRDRVIIVSTHVVEDLRHLAARIAILQKGRLRFLGGETELARKAAETVYEIEVQASHLSEIKTDHWVTSYGQASRPGHTRVRLLARGTPPSGAVLVEPTLEDGYLALIKEGERVA